MTTNKNILKRHHVEERLRACAAYPVTFVCAPLGYGKTTAVRSYVHGEHSKTLWISGVKNDEGLFWKRLCGLFAHSHPEWSNPFTSLCFPLSDSQLEQFIDTLKKALTEPCVLVIDDYHLLETDSPLQHLLFVLALEQISRFRVICVGRNVPKNMMAELLAKDLCALITSDTLAFTREEVAAYLALHKAAEPSAAHRLAEQVFSATEGWISAIFLISEGLRLGQNVHSLESTYRLFESAVFGTLDPYARLLLIKLSVFEEFTLPEATFVLESTGTHQLMEELEARNAFVNHNVATGTYRLHSLFRHYLQYKAGFFDFDIRRIHYRMGVWHLEHKNISAALRWYHKANRVEELFERLHIDDRQHFEPEDCELFQTILQSLPESAALRFPLIYLHLSLLLFLSGNAAYLRTANEQIARLQQHFIDVADDHPLRERIRCELRIVASIAKFNDPYVVFELLDGSGDAVMGEVARPLAPFAAFSFGLPSLIYNYLRQPGELDSLVNYMITRYDPDSMGGMGYGFDKLLQAEVHLERCETHLARHYAEQAILKSPLKNQCYITGCAQFVLMRLAVFEGDLRDAFARLDAIRFEIPASATLPMSSYTVRMYATFADLCETYLLCIIKNSKRINARLRSGSRFGKLFMFRGLGIIELGTIKIKILDGKFAEAEIMADYYEKEFATYHTQLGLLRCKVFRSIILYNMRDEEGAITILRQALEEAACDRIRLLFAENADFILPILAEVRKAPPRSGPCDAAYLEAVHAACLQFSQNLKQRGQGAGCDILTSRELEVFQHLTRGQSQKSMATELNISISTVKRHLESIYAKFGVNNRVAALNKGASLGL